MMLHQTSASSSNLSLSEVFFLNISTNFSNITETKFNQNIYSWWQRAFFASFIFPIIIITITGNIFVLIAIIKYKSLHIVGTIFLASMAVADSAVGLFAMPLNALQLLSGHWYLGASACR